MKNIFLVLFLCILYSISASIIVQDRLTHVFHVNPGDVVSGSIYLLNPDNRAVSVNITQSDLSANEYYDVIFLFPGTYHRSNASWISLSNTIVARQNATATIPFTIHVPNDPELYGSYWSVISIQPDSDIAEILDDQWTFIVRYHVQIITNIIDTGTLDLQFSDVVVSNEMISITLINTGTLWFESDINIDIVNNEALFVGSFYSRGNRVYPGHTREVHIPVMLESNTVYHAIIIADCGDNNIFGHQVTFTIE